MIRRALIGLALGAAACSGGTVSPPGPSSTAGTVTSLTLRSAAFTDGGLLPAPYACAARTGLATETNPPLDWSDVPAATAQFVLLMSTVANDAGGTVTKYNWVLYEIPVSTRAIPERNTVISGGSAGVTLVGTPGLTSDGPQLAYSAPCSAAGSGRRTYTFTLYAVSAAPAFAFNRVPGAGGDGANLAAALPSITLARASISAAYVF